MSADITMVDRQNGIYNIPAIGDYAVAQPDSPSGDDSDSLVDHHHNGGSKKRQRPMNVTCEACKARKVKCDRQHPACGWCSRNDHVCEYKERKKPGLRAGYGRELESKMQDLEQLVRDYCRRLDTHLDACKLSSSSGGDRPPVVAHPVPFASPQGSRKSYDAQATVVAADYHGQNSFQQHALDPTLQPSMPHHPGTSLSQTVGPQQALSDTPNQFPKQQVQHVPSVNSHPMQSPESVPTVGSVSAPPQQQQQQQQQPLQQQPLQQQPLQHQQHQQHQQYGFGEQTAPLPPYDLLYSLVDLFFKHINPWFPILDRKTTLDRLFGVSPLEEADRVLLHALVAVSLRFSKDARLTPESRQRYHSTSKQKVQLFGLENSSVRSLQALVILSIDVTGDTNGPPGWNLIALISRNVVQLGLSVEATSSLAAPVYPSIATLRALVLPEAKTWIEDEARRRLFWAVYLLDRFATIATAFEFALDEREVDRRLPCRDDFFFANKPVETRYFRSPESTRYAAAGVSEVHGHLSYLCELCGILSHIHQFLKRPIDICSLADVERWQASYRALDSELNAWHFSLPDEFTNITRLVKANMPAKNVSCGWITLHAAYLVTVIRLNSSAGYPSQTSPIFSSSYSAMQRCLRAVDSMRKLAHFVSLNRLLDRLGPPFAFTLWVCSRVTLVHGSTMDTEADPDIGLFVTILSEMGQYWEVAQRYSEILSRVLNEYRQSQRSVGVNGERVTPSTVRILADMRRCAYDLDFLISRQPTHAVKSYHPTRQNTPAPNELEYLDVFDLFNFPRLPSAAMVTGNGAESETTTTTGATGITMNHAVTGDPSLATATNMDSGIIQNFTVPDPETDWLFHPR